jgi:hypothetical protein
MKNFPMTGLACLFLFFTLTGLTCEREECGLARTAVEWIPTSLKNLDNRGPVPVELSPGQLAHRAAYGIRFTTQSILSEPTDTIGFTCFDYYLEAGVTKVEIFTLLDFGAGAFNAGANVSKLFKCVNASTSEYVAMDDALGYLYPLWSTPGTHSSDFLLVAPPSTTSWSRFKLVFHRQDSSQFVAVTDSIFLL